MEGTQSQLSVIQTRIPIELCDVVNTDLDIIVLKSALF